VLVKIEKLEEIEKILNGLIKTPDVTKENHKYYGMKLNTISDLLERLRLVHDGRKDALIKRIGVIGNGSNKMHETHKVYLGGNRIIGRS